LTWLEAKHHQLGTQMEKKHPNVGATGLCDCGYRTQMKTQRGNFGDAVIFGR